MLISDFRNQRVRRVFLTTATVTTTSAAVNNAVTPPPPGSSTAAGLNTYFGSKVRTPGTIHTVVGSGVRLRPMNVEKTHDL